MKKIFFFLIILYIFTGCKNDSKAADKKIIVSATLKNSKDDSEKGVETLKDFYYTFYGNDDLYNDENSKKKYVSGRILEKIQILTSDEENLILDYDPFIKAQDFDGNVIKKTLEIKPLEAPNEYRVSFLLFGDKDEKRTTIDLLLKKSENGRLLIYSILNDDYLNFKTLNESNFDGKYKMIREVRADINNDGKQDQIAVFSTKWNTEIKPTDYKQYKTTINLSNNHKFTSLTNTNIIAPYFPDNVASGFSDIKVKNNYFTIEQANGGGNIIERSYTTFKYDKLKNGIFLHKYSTITTDRNSGDENEIKSEYSEKDFGNISFEKYDPKKDIDKIIK